MSADLPQTLLLIIDAQQGVVPGCFNANGVTERTEPPWALFRP
ncbi:hypothetical protein [Microbacterium halophytorum]|nr:hypothetical protein [Microbacterium halophytorum]